MFHIHKDDPPGKAKILIEGLRLFVENGLSATSIPLYSVAINVGEAALWAKHGLCCVIPLSRCWQRHGWLQEISAAAAPNAIAAYP